MIEAVGPIRTVTRGASRRPLPDPRTTVRKVADLDAISLHCRCHDRQTVVVEERFPGELETLRADNVRLRRLLKLSEEQTRAADPDQATLSGAPESPVNMASTPEAKVRFYLDLFRCR